MWFYQETFYAFESYTRLDFIRKNTVLGLTLDKNSFYQSIISDNSA